MDVSKQFAIEVWGDRACFTRPELSVERMSYDVITPSAARGLIEAIYWHPGMHYKIDSINVLNPITFTNVRRNEVDSKALASSMLSAYNGKAPIPHLITSQAIQQRAALILTDVRYVIEAHFEYEPTSKNTPDDNVRKFEAILNRRMAKGQCYTTPYFGVREFPANFKPAKTGERRQGAYSNEAIRELGLMLYDMDYSDPSCITPMYFRASMRYGVIDVAGSEVFR